MDEIRKPITSQDILKLNINNSRTQREALTKSADALNNPQLTKYLNSIGSAIEQTEKLDEVILSKLTGVEKPVEKGIVSKLKGLIKGFL